MKEWATHLKPLIHRHHVWSSVVLIVLLGGLGVGLYWTVYLVRFGLPPPPGQNCGELIHEDWNPERTARIDADLQSLQCFWQAYHTCRAATISQTYAGVDAGYTDVVTIEQRWLGCALYGKQEIFSNLETSSTIFLCTRLSQVGETLQVASCDGIAPFALVPHDTIADSYLCGVIGAPSNIDLPQEVEACFFVAYQHCLADSMGYRTLISGVQVERGFYIDTQCGIAYQRGSSLAACASLESRADGIQFLQCGTDGDLIVPSASP
jgi:hypothetical protein